MKIVIDARLYGLEHAGPGRYVKNLVDSLMSIDRKNDYILLLRKKYFNKLKTPSNFKKKLTDYQHYTISEQINLPIILYRQKADIVHFPMFNIPIFFFGKFVVTIHDLTMHRSKGGEATTRSLPKYLIWRLGYQIAFLNSVYRSQKIIVPSNYVKNDIASFYKIRKEKIVVTYEGVDKTFVQKIKKDVYKKYGLKKPYFIYSGSAYPHKNIQKAIDAIIKLNQKSKDKVELALTSSRSVFTKRLIEWVRAKKAESYVKYLGFVSDRDLASLFNTSEAFIYPTLSEGFGLPGLEAMQAKTLVLCSEIEVLKEVYKDKAIFFDPKDTGSITESMQKILNINKSERKDIINSYSNLMKKYSWEKMARKTLEVYENSLQGSN